MSQPTSDGKLIAVARADASIEIWLRNSWSQIATIPGNQHAVARNLFWFEQGKSSAVDANLLYSGGKKRRLITTGLNGQVIEWNILDGTIRNKFSANAAIWDAQLI